jgi:hypothetical protein
MDKAQAVRLCWLKAQRVEVELNYRKYKDLTDLLEAELSAMKREIEEIENESS